MLVCSFACVWQDSATPVGENSINSTFFANSSAHQPTRTVLRGISRGIKFCTQLEGIILKLEYEIVVLNSAISSLNLCRSCELSRVIERG